MISYVNQSDLQKYELTTDYVNSIDLQILDEAGNYVDFNNSDWSITLGISIERVDVQKQNTDSENLFYHIIFNPKNKLQPNTNLWITKKYKQMK